MNGDLRTIKLGVSMNGATRPQSVKDCDRCISIVMLN